ncbi:uncharacterized protein N7477_005264, partial [Penicillium maclennaniae]|uniref:uncharacterized protein n=1 Tax=Penicillium maclennaniae TaxID=1343394 RepID=UPI0025420C80
NSLPTTTIFMKSLRGQAVILLGAGTQGTRLAYMAAVLESWLVVECVPETLSLKRSVIKQLDDLATSQIIVASNSSSYAITEILGSMDVKSPIRFASLHSYWAPETPGKDTYFYGIYNIRHLTNN